jgi:alpha-N-arabinofuranosidase
VKKILLLVLFTGLIMGSCLNGVSFADEASPQIAIDLSDTGSEISPDLFGAIINWTRNAEGGADPATGKAYESFVEAIKETGVTSIRYGGGTISATCFMWKRAIGPLDERPMNRARDGKPGQPSIFGPDEIGDLIERVGCKGCMTMNFSRDTLQSNADYLAYLTLPANDQNITDETNPQYWANLRAKNGHPEPYNFNIFDVGNEEEMFTRWRSGRNITTVQINDHSTDVDNDAMNLYLFGGKTLISNEAAIGYADMDAASGSSQGTADQSFYVQYPPVVDDSQTIYVAGTEWTEVADLATAGPTDMVYTFDNVTGEIRFVDGTHGAIPVSGSAITSTYTCVHDGYVQYYNKLKPINPDIDISLELGNVDVPQAMGTAYPYDSIDTHPLSTGFPSNSLSEYEYAKQMYFAGLNQTGAGSNLQDLKDTVLTYSGSVPQVVNKAYGHGQRNMSSESASDCHLYLIEALNQANELIAYQNMGLKVAHRFLLNDTPYNPDVDDAPTARRFNAMIISDGTNPNYVIEPIGYCMGIMSKLGGKTQVGCSVTNNPVVTCSDSRTYGALNTIAAVDSDGNVDLIVVNWNLDNSSGDVTANITVPGFVHRSLASVTTLNGPEYTSKNTLTEPYVVTNTTKDVSVGTGDFDYTFPAHSITRIHLIKGTKTYGIASIPSQSFTTLIAGYASGSQETKSITITKSGTGELTNLAAALSGTNAESFIITQPAVTALDYATPSTTFTVKAKLGVSGANGYRVQLYTDSAYTNCVMDSGTASLITGSGYGLSGKGLSGGYFGTVDAWATDSSGNPLEIARGICGLTY